MCARREQAHHTKPRMQAYGSACGHFHSHPLKLYVSAITIRTMLMRTLPITLTTLPLQLLTFGDSLTAGLTDRDAPYTPYGRAMQDELEKCGLPAAVISSGIVMESVHSMPCRLQDECAHVAYDSILIIGGSNDLWKNDVDAIWASLLSLYTHVREHAQDQRATPPLGVATLPPFKPDAMRWFGGRRDVVTRLTDLTRRKVNQRIRAEARRPGSRAFLVDLAALSESRPGFMAADGIHLTPGAYDALGREAARSFYAAQHAVL